MVKVGYMLLILFTILLNISCKNNPTSSAKDDSLDNKVETGTVTDIDGNIYQTVKIGEQWWMAENLRVTHYRNGQPIPNITDREEWKNLTTGAYCVYNNNPIYAETFGYLYNFYAVMDSQGLAPAGWHIPTSKEWLELEKFLGMDSHDLYYEDSEHRGTDEGGKLKESGYAYWDYPNAGATNLTQFSARPGGYRGYTYYSISFYDMGKQAYFWTSSIYDHSIYDGSPSSALCRILFYDKSSIGIGSYRITFGFSVRCVKNEE